ncbi:MAG: hypothetical protein E7051_06735 [Lentisphaerae bacterium]|nr:hypothetical protein [Lentisphaerota bacterium]
MGIKRSLQIFFSLLVFAFVMLFFSPWYVVKEFETEFFYSAQTEVNIALASDHEGDLFSREKLLFARFTLPESDRMQKVKLQIPAVQSNIFGLRIEVADGKKIAISNLTVKGRKKSYSADWKKDLPVTEGVRTDGGKLIIDSSAAVTFPVRIKTCRVLQYKVFSAALIIALAAAGMFFFRIKVEPARELFFITAAMILMLFPVMRLDIWSVVSDENRFFQKFPSLTKKFPKEFELYLGDRFFCRGKMIKLNRKIFESNLFSGGTLARNSKAFYGKEGWIFSTGFDSVAMAQNLNRFTADELRECARRLDAVADEFAARFNAPVFVVLMPDKERVYEEYYPDFLLKQRRHKQSRLEQLTDYLRKHSKVTVIAPLPQLLEKKKEYQLYYMGGTHQTPQGAYISAQEIKKAIMEKFPHLEAVPENISKWKTGRNGDIDAAMQLGLKPEEDLDDKYIAAPEPEFIFRHDLRKMQEIPQISLLTRHFVSGNRNYRGLRILTVADSFWGYISPFMVPLASEEIYAFYGSGKDFVFEPFAADIRNFKPQAVIIESTERFLHRFLTIKYGE